MSFIDFEAHQLARKYEMFYGDVYDTLKEINNHFNNEALFIAFRNIIIKDYMYDSTIDIYTITERILSHIRYNSPSVYRKYIKDFIMFDNTLERINLRINNPKASNEITFNALLEALAIEPENLLNNLDRFKCCRFSDNGLLIQYDYIYLEIVTLSSNCDLEIIELDNGFLGHGCQEGIYTCEHCSSSFHEDETASYTVINKYNEIERICENCIHSSIYRYTDNTDYPVHENNTYLYYNTVNDNYLYFDSIADLEYYCTCNGLNYNLDNELKQASLILDDLSMYEIYDYQTEVLVDNLDKDVIYYGVELEVELDDSEEGDRDDAFDMFIKKYYSNTNNCMDFLCKEDGSLNDGFEIVSKPLEYLDCIKYLSRISESLKGCNLTSHSENSCGFHIHISKSPLSQNQIDFMIAFLNIRDNQLLIQKIGNREFNQYCKSSKIELENDLLDNIELADLIRNRVDKYNRYVVLNTIPQNTIEFRFFKGSFNETRMHSYIQFVNALIKYSEIQTNKENFSISGKDFIHWVEDIQEYKDLMYLINDFCIEKNLTKYSQLKLMEV